MSTGICQVCGREHTGSACPSKFERQVSRAIVNMFPDLKYNAQDIAAAELRGERKGYERALDDVIEIAFRDFEFVETLRDELVQLKSDYLQEGEDGKTE